MRTIAKLECFAGQYNKYEGLTVNFAEAVNGAGGVIVGDDGKPNVATPEATKGLQTLVDWFKNGDIPKGAITWQEEQGRQAFQNGTLIFHRNWGYVYALAAKTDGSSKIVGKFDVAPLPGITGPGVSSLGGHNYAIATNAENKGTAVEVPEVHVLPGGSEVEHAGHLRCADVSPRSTRMRTSSKKFPFYPDAAEVGRDRHAAADRGRVR